MRTIKSYVALAMEKSQARSYRKLSELLGVSNTVVAEYLKSRMLPSDDVMVRLAALAEIKPEVALLELRCWKTRNNAAVYPLFKQLAESAAKSVLVILFAFACALLSLPVRTEAAQALTRGASLYIMENNRWRRMLGAATG